MRAVGFDPGLADTGYAALELAGRRPAVLGKGVIRTAAGLALEERLNLLFEETARVLARYGPAFLVVEDVFSAPTVPRTAILVGYARAVICLAGRRAGAAVVSVTRAEVKRAVTLSGAASKGQVARGVQALLGLAAPPRPSHVADALALAFTGLSRARGAGRVDGAARRRASG